MVIEADFDFDCEACEFKSIFGSRGECINDTFCLCDEGFTGIDDWLVHQDCHVNIDLAFYVNAVLLLFKALGFIASIVAVIWLSRRWKLSVFAQIPGRSRGSTKKADANRRLLSLRINTIRVNLFLAMFTAVGVGYNGLFLRETEDDRATLRDSFPFHAICLSFSYTGILGALFLMLLTWYDTLPDVRAFGTLFEVDPIFIKYPTLVRKICFFMIAGSLILPLAINVLIPLINDDLYVVSSYILVSVSLIYVGSFGVLQYFVISSVMKIFNDFVLRRQKQS